MLTFVHDLTPIDWLIGGAVFCIAVYLIGAVGHAVLKHNGFGTVVNGLLLVLGMAMGVFARAVTIGFHS